jgi:hypothetical protein
MKKIIKKIFLYGFIAFLLLQFYQPARNTDHGKILPVDITKMHHVPKNIENILQTSCFDCHSNNTNYPWYSYIQPARFILESDIKNGKEDLNFSEWGNYSERKQQSKLDRIEKQIKSGEMPLPMYTLTHKKAILTSTQKDEIYNWINTLKKDE